MLLLLVILGVCGNVLSYITFIIRKPPTLATVYLKALAVADTTLLVIVLVRLLLNHIPLDNQVIESVTVLLFYVLDDIARFTSVWITVLLAFSRLLAICNPFFVKTHIGTKTITKSVIAVVVSACMIVAARMWMVIKREVKTCKNDTRCTFCADFEVPQTRIIEISFYGGLLFLLPTLLLVVFSGSLLVNLKRSVARWCHPHLQQEYRDITKTVLVIVLVFFLTYTPFGVVAVIYLNPYLHYHFDTNICDESILYEYMGLAIYLNSSVNFLIYMVCHASFRESFSQLICKRSAPCAAFVC